MRVLLYSNTFESPIGFHMKRKPVVCKKWLEKMTYVLVLGAESDKPSNLILKRISLAKWHFWRVLAPNMLAK